MRAFLVLLLAVCGLLLAGCGERASDGVLAERLAAQRIAFERIVSIFEEIDGLADVDREPGGPSSISADPAVAKASIQVREELARAGMARVLRDSASGGLLFVAEEAGVGISGASKGLLHAPVLPEALRAALVEDTEIAFEAERDRQKEGEGLELTLIRHLDGAWYVLLETY